MKGGGEGPGVTAIVAAGADGAKAVTGVVGSRLTYVRSGDEEKIYF